MRSVRSWGLGIVCGLGLGLGAPGVQAESDACREWQQEHRDWKIEALQATLRGRPQAAIDETIFEVLQREAYLTSCETAVPVARSELIGWRLVGRSPEQYGAALLESVLAQAGFDLELGQVSQGVAGMAPGRRQRLPSPAPLEPLRPWRQGLR